MIIDNLIAEHGEINGDVLSAWCNHFEISSSKAAEILLANPRSFEAWRSNRYKTPQFLVFALQNAEAKVLKNKKLKNKSKKVKKK